MVSTIQRQGGASSMQQQHSPQPSSAASTPAPTPSTITSGSQQPKRLRLACDSCHGAKIRCSGGQPCKKCHNSNLQCKYSYMARLGKPKGSRNKKTLERLAAAAESPSNTSTTANGSGSGSSSSSPGSSEAMRKSLSHGAGTPSLSTSSLSEYDLHPSSASSTSSSVSSSSSAVSSASSPSSSVLQQQQSPVGWPTLSPNLYAPMDHHHGHHGLHNHHAAHQASLDLCLETSSLRGLLDADAGLSPTSPEGLLPLSLISPMDKDTQSLLAYHSYLSPSTSDVLNPFDDKSDGDWGFGASLHQHRSAMAMSVADTSNTHSPSPMMQQQQHASLANLAKSPPMSGIGSSGSSVHGGSNTNAYGSPEHHDVSGMSMPSDDAARQQQPPGACGCLRILTNKLCALNEVERKSDHLRLDTTLSKGSAVLTCSATALACPLCLLDSKVILLVMTLLQTIINWARDGCGSSTAPQDSPPVVFGEWPVSREDGNAVRAVLITRVMTRTATTLDVLRQRIRDFAAVAKQQKLAYQAMEAEALQATLQRVIHSMSEVTQMIKAKGLDA